jgi:hypothetical protein
MKTSSSVGRDTATEVIPRPRSPRPRSPNRSRSALSAAASSAVPSTTRSAPTSAFCASGPAVHDRDPVAQLGLVHVVLGHEDRHALGLLQRANLAQIVVRVCESSPIVSSSRNSKRGESIGPRAIFNPRRMSPENRRACSSRRPASTT